MMYTALPEAGPDGRARAGALARLHLADVTPTSIVEFVSRGRCLVIGAEDDALDLVRHVAGRVECVVAVPGDAAPDVDRIDGTYVVRGGRPLVRGSLGNFDVQLATGGTPLALGTMLTPPIDRFDLVVDLGTPRLLQQAMPPLGYYAPDPDPAARAALADVLPEMRGEFEKPKYFNYNPEICAHGRSGKRGCTRCIDACPAEAIVSLGDKVQVNPYLCQGGGTCATSCPSGAMTYAYPVPGDLLYALQRLLRDYRDAGGTSPSLLFHDSASGARG
jgi:ferredoxin